MIAVVGASCRLPGGESLEAFGELLRAGGDAVSEIPDDRWSKPLFFHPERGQRGRAYTFAAGVLSEPFGFDPGFFGISPREAVQMDPQQRLLLELAQEALDDGGMIGAQLSGAQAGVYVGGSSWDYLNLNLADVASTDAYSMTGSTLCSLSNRISYAFDLRGPSLTVDTACSSSLVALHLACEALREGRVALAFVGGVNMLLAPHSYIGFCRASMLSPQGRCHAFDQRADGYVRAEGGGVLILKPLADALDAGDPVRAVIHGTAVNSDGRTNGLSLPNPAAQAALLREVYGRFDIAPDDLSYMEAHGTGTPVGDPIEATALGEALGARRESPLPMGSVKTNIGHLEAGSGMAGLLKALHVIRTRSIPKSLHCETPNPAIPLHALNLRVVTEAEAIPAGAPGLVGINSFGFGGTNAHAVLGPAPRVQAPAGGIPTVILGAAATPPPPLLLSARSPEAVRALAASWSHKLASDGGGDALGPMLRGAARAREHYPHRLAVVGGSATELLAGLDAFTGGRDSGRVFAGKAAEAGKVAFVYGGNGSQWTGMAADAMRHSAAFRHGLNEADEALAPHIGWSARARLLGGLDEAALAEAAVAQPVLFAVQVATVMALRQEGVQPSAHLGHSVGEVAAAWGSGALDLPQAARVIAIRSRQQQRLHGSGAMAVLALSAEDAAPALHALDSRLEIAATNASRSVTVAGPNDAIERLQSEALRKGWAFSKLGLAYAFHSALMDPIRADVIADLDWLLPERWSEPFISSVTGAQLTGRALDGDYWWRNVREPVRFGQAARSLVADGVRVFLEISPQPVLQAYLNDALNAADAAGGVQGRVIAALNRRPARHDPMQLAAVRCYVAGHDITAAAAFDGPMTRQGLPRYPWQREEFRLERSTGTYDVLHAAKTHPLLGFPADGQGAWYSFVDLASQPWLSGHAVGGSPVMPAAAMIDMALAAARQRAPRASGLELWDVEIKRPLVLEPGVTQTLSSQVEGASGRFDITSQPRLADAGRTQHLTCRIAALAAPAADLPPLAPRTSSLAADDLYILADRLGLRYSGAFRPVLAVDLCGPDDAIVHFATGPDGAARRASGYMVDPALMDGALQGVIALAAERLNLRDGDDAGVMPWRFGRVRLFDASGAEPVTARLHLRRVGPRAVCADVMLLQADGSVCAELRECWFVRVALAKPVRNDTAFVRTALVVAEPGLPDGPAPDLVGIAIGSLGSGGNDDSGALADAFVAAATAEALTQAGVDLGAGQADVTAPYLAWLEQDGLAEQTEDGWRVLPEIDGVTASAILQSFVYEQPEAAADAALLAGEAEALARRVTGQPADDARAPDLLDAFLTASPAGARAAAGLAEAAIAIAQSWPRDRPFRVLELGARRGATSRALAEMLRDAHPAVTYLAVASERDFPSVASGLDAMPGVRALAAEHLGSLAEGSMHLVLGLYCLTRNPAATLDAARQVIAPGGTVLFVEPAPNRVWSFLRPLAAATLRPGATWANDLAHAGFAQAASRELAPALWPACLIAARSARQHQRPTGTMAGPITVAGESGDGLADALVGALAGAGAVVTRADLRTSAVNDLAVGGQLVLTVPEAQAGSRAMSDWLARLAGLATALSQAATPTWLIGRTAWSEHGSLDPAVSAAMGARRVLANEAPTIACRMVQVDPAMDPATMADRVVMEMASPSGEAEIAWDGTRRRVGRVVTGLPLPAGPHAAAATLVIDRPGLLDTLRFAPATARALLADEVAIEVRAAGLNFRDVMWAMGLLPDEALLDGFAGPTLGLECAGVVAEVGSGVTDLVAGDRVMAFAPASLATTAISRRHAVVQLPDAMDFAGGATIPVAFITVAYALGTLADLQEGERVLIHGGAGAVGLAAVQYARLRGAVVFATAGSPAKRALLRRLGADHVLDSRKLRFADDVMAITGGEGVDVVLNSLSGEAMERSLGLLRPFGRFLELGKRDFYENTAVGLRPLRHNVTYHAIDADQLPLRRPKLAQALLREISEHLQHGRLQPLPRRTFPFADVADAFRLMQASGHVGKIVLVPGSGLRTVAPPSPPFQADADGTFVVTGGLSGFGLEAARWLVAKGARHLALISRRGAAAPGVETALNALRNEGVTCLAIACDVGEARALAAALDQVRASMPPITGIMHAAAVLDDALLPNLDSARIQAVLRPKWDAADQLDALTRRDPVSLFVLFSSVAVLLGNPGQANYVAGNAAMEAVARRRHQAGLPALAVGWGPIADAGMLSRDKATGDALQRHLGSRLLTAADALDALPSMLASGLPAVTYAPLDWAVARQRLPLLDSPVFEAVRGAQAAARETDIRALLEGQAPDEARATVARLLAEEVGGILKLPSSRIDMGQPLPDIGMDSLMAIELRLAMEARFGVSLPLFALNETTTIASIAAIVVRSVLGGVEAPNTELEQMLARYESEAAPADQARLTPEPEPSSFALQADRVP